MATILPFAIHKPTVHTPRKSGAAAAIIIFPGVRYEKADARPKPAGGKGAAGSVRPRKRKG